MLINGSRLAGCAILSLHVGGAIARVVEPIIDPNTLKLIALRVEGPLIRDEVGDILPIESVREFSRAGMIVDSVDEFVDGDDVVRLKEILKLKFELTGLKVVTKKGEKLGKVSDYVLNTASWEVHQLIVQRPVLKALIDPELTIARQAIVEVNDYEVIVKEERGKSKKASPVKVPADFVPDFVNPFRKPDFATESRANPEKQD